jgi:hypothetical protein
VYTEKREKKWKENLLPLNILSFNGSMLLLKYEPTVERLEDLREAWRRKIRELAKINVWDMKEGWKWEECYWEGDIFQWWL